MFRVQYPSKIDKEKAAKVPLETETPREKNKQTHKTKPKASTISPSTKPKHGSVFGDG